jgi:hypothetical protein
LVDVDDGRVVSVEFLPLDVVRFDEFEMDVAGIPDVAGLVDALVEAARKQAATQDGRTVILRVSLTGRGAVHQDLRHGHVRDSVLFPTRTALAAATQTVWLDTVEDRTSPEIDVEALRGRGDFAADLVETTDSVLATPAERSELVGLHLNDLPCAELRRLVGDAVDAVPTDEEIRAALDVALDRVTEAE